MPKVAGDHRSHAQRPRPVPAGPPQIRAGSGRGVRPAETWAPECAKPMCGGAGSPRRSSISADIKGSLRWDTAPNRPPTEDFHKVRFTMALQTPTIAFQYGGP